MSIKDANGPRRSITGARAGSGALSFCTHPLTAFGQPDIVVAGTSEGGQPMIERYSDHAANERTFLAWVRTAIAIMAFGFVVTKFDLFLKVATQSLHLQSPSTGREFIGTTAGMLLIVLGGAMMERPRTVGQCKLGIS